MNSANNMAGAERAAPYTADISADPSDLVR